MAHKSEAKGIFDIIIALIIIIFSPSLFFNNNINFITTYSGLLLFVVFSVLILVVLLSVLYRLSSTKNKKLTLKPLVKTHVRDDSLDDIAFYAPSSFPLEELTPTPIQWDQDLLSSLEWKRFEQLCSDYFVTKGFQARLTRCGADGGVDVRIYKDNILSSVVQCKAYKNYKIGIKPIRELFGVMASENVKHGFFITTSRFTREAVKFSNKNPSLKLVDGDLLLKWINELPDHKQKTLLETITDGDYTTPTCPNCDVKMVLRTSSQVKNRGEKFWGCVNFPKCRHTFKYN